MKPCFTLLNVILSFVVYNHGSVVCDNRNVPNNAAEEAEINVRLIDEALEKHRMMMENGGEEEDSKSGGHGESKSSRDEKKDIYRTEATPNDKKHEPHQERRNIKKREIPESNVPSEKPSVKSTGKAKSDGILGRVKRACKQLKGLFGGSSSKDL